MKIFFCGDIMPGGVLPYQNEYISSELQKYMNSFDFRIGTLEAAIGTNLAYDPIKMQGRQNIVYARNEDFFRIKEMGFNVLSLANNHVCDLGEEGLKNTINILKANGIKYCGAGLNKAESSSPAVIEKDGKKIAILAYCMYGNPYLGYVELATDDKSGINPLDIEQIEKDIRNLKHKYDYVIVMPHWGREYYYQPIYECVELAHRMVDAGADAVVASHPHQIQPVVKYKGKTIAFSMGNFLFPDFYMSPPRPIWYPRHDEDLSNVKDFVGYPFPISEPIKQVWNKKSRVGSIIQMEINNSIKVKTRYVKNSRRNIVDLHHLDFITKTIITIYGIGTQNKVLHLLLRKGTSFIRIIKRIFHF